MTDAECCLLAAYSLGGAMPSAFFLLSGPESGPGPKLRAPQAAAARQERRPTRTGVRRLAWAPVAVLCCCSPGPAVRITLLTSGAKGTRTPDPLLAKQVLFQLSYSPVPRRFSSPASRRYKGTRSPPTQRAPQQRALIRGAAPAKQPQAAQIQAAPPVRIQAANQSRTQQARAPPDQPPSPRSPGRHGPRTPPGPQPDP
jgi:hypothetical protein